MYFRMSGGIICCISSLHHGAVKSLAQKCCAMRGWAIPYRSFSIVQPSRVQPVRSVPSHIPRPSYVGQTGIASRLRNLKLATGAIEVKSEAQIDGMREACKLARHVLNVVGACAKPGVTTDELDRIGHKTCILNDAYPSPLQYKGFPKSICTSVNNVACHGIPDDRPLEDGDIVNIDITVFYKGFHGDVSETFLIGNVDATGRDLVNVTRMCLNKAIGICGPGQRFSLIGKTISALAEEMGYEAMPHFCGHGIGSFFHGPPDIIHVDNDLPGVMVEGITFTIEPVVCEGDTDIRILPDGWTAVTTDDSRSAQFEHTVLITRHGHEILTL